MFCHMPTQHEIWAQVLPVMTVSVFVFGTIVGSFLNVVVWRLPRSESLIFPGSHCPKCQHAIRPYENIPILSWIFLRGRCSQCHQPISFRYPLVELATGCIFLLLWWRVWFLGIPLQAIFPYVFLGASLFAIAMIDIEHLIIPDRLTFTGITAAFIFAIAFPATRMTPSLPGLPGADQLILGWLLEKIPVAAGRGLGRVPWGLAICDAATGAVFGYGLLWLVREAGKRLWGRRYFRAAAALDLSMDSCRLNIPGVYSGPWELLFQRRKDRFQAWFSDGILCTRTDDSAPVEHVLKDGSELMVCRNGIRIDDQTCPLEKVVSCTGRMTRCILPREVMGRGDLKLLAMIGAFLGADSCIFVLLFSSLSGSLWGVIRTFVRPGLRQIPLPFGPFLAFGTMFWILLGSDFITWYGYLLRR